ncbi:hypothetical protein WA026_007495 [Henosepilachna vigintioctopunctata]|uniref:Secreted protein n=1 Tax=Henosepilachna vigintioctopunctata TaxID=420089 RepID=A0AAW1UMB8_9CUCU
MQSIIILTIWLLEVWSHEYFETNKSNGIKPRQIDKGYSSRSYHSSGNAEFTQGYRPTFMSVDRESACRMEVCNIQQADGAIQDGFTRNQ